MPHFPLEAGKFVPGSVAFRWHAARGEFFTWRSSRVADPLADLLHVAPATFLPMQGVLRRVESLGNRLTRGFVSSLNPMRPQPYAHPSTIADVPGCSKCVPVCLRVFMSLSLCVSVCVSLCAFVSVPCVPVSCVSVSVCLCVSV